MNIEKKTGEYVHTLCKLCVVFKGVFCGSQFGGGVRNSVSGEDAKYKFLPRPTERDIEYSFPAIIVVP